MQPHRKSSPMTTWALPRSTAKSRIQPCQIQPKLCTQRNMDDCHSPVKIPCCMCLCSRMQAETIEKCAKILLHRGVFRTYGALGEMVSAVHTKIRCWKNTCIVAPSMYVSPQKIHSLPMWWSRKIHSANSYSLWFWLYLGIHQRGFSCLPLQ